MNPQTVRIMCPNLTCRKVLAVPAAARGKTVRCRACGTNIRVPSGVKPAAQEPATQNPTPEAGEDKVAA